VQTKSDAVPCAVCGRSFSRQELRACADLTPGARRALAADHPDLSPDDLICRTDLALYRRRSLERLLESERGALSALDHQVLDSLQTGAPLTAEAEAAFGEDRTLGERAADALARFGGSWGFIICFGVVLAVWMAVNVSGAVFGVFDPYPFILLNLVLSSLAAIQAPVIMMSQRRQEEKDRLRSENDYKINLKAELEIRHLHDKIDLHLARQWERLAAIQRLQIEMLEESAGDERP
jgi:uncharacterized membrane protein